QPPGAEIQQDRAFSVIRLLLDLVGAFFCSARSLICALFDAVLRFLCGLLRAVFNAFARLLRGFFCGVSGIFHVLLGRTVVLVALPRGSGRERNRSKGGQQKNRELLFHFFTPPLCWSVFPALRFRAK